MSTAFFPKDCMPGIVLLNLIQQKSFTFFIGSCYHIVHIRFGLYTQIISPEIGKLYLSNFFRPGYRIFQCLI